MFASVKIPDKGTTLELRVALAERTRFSPMAVADSIESVAFRGRFLRLDSG